MTASSHDTNRAGDRPAKPGTSNAATTSISGHPRDLPVLFQLTDVSRPRGGKPRSQPGPSVAMAASTASQLNLSPPVETPVPKPSIVDTSLLTLSELSKPYTPAALEPSTLWTPSVASLLDDPASLLAGSAAAPTTATQTTTEPKAKVAVATEAKASEAAKSDKSKDAAATTPKREALVEPSKRRQSDKKSDWFSSHGKLIAIGFVLALAATVIIARNQKSPAPTSDDQWAMKHPGDAADKLAGDGPTIELPGTDTTSTPSDVQPATTVDEASPAAADKLVERAAKEAASSPSQVDLLPPTLPQQTIAETAPTNVAPPLEVAEKPATETVSPQSGDPLFRWPQPEARVAARPEATAPAAAMAQRPVNPGEVMNPYTRQTAPPAGPAPVEDPAARTASRSPYVLPGSPQDVSGSAPATGGYAPAPAASGASAYGSAPVSGYSNAPAYSQNPGYSSAAPYSAAPTPPSSAPATSVYAPAPAYSAAPQAGGYSAPPPTTPSPYLPVNPGAPPTGQAPPAYGAPPAGTPNTQPPPSGYRYERTGSGLY